MDLDFNSLPEEIDNLVAEFPTLLLFKPEQPRVPVKFMRKVFSTQEVLRFVHAHLTTGQTKDSGVHQDEL